MEPALQKLIDQLPASATELTEDNIAKIHEYLPVPTDFQILWADILSFNGYPAGIVLTDKALVVKATKNEVKQANGHIKAQNKEDKAKSPLLGSIYRIIPWEYFSPEDYKVELLAEGKEEKRYVIKTSETALAQFSSEALYHLFSDYRNMAEEQRRLAESIIENSTHSAISSINLEGTIFNATWGADNATSGHGFYAEEAGTILDKLNGEQSTVVGYDNAKNGPDKVVNAAPVQCKYYGTATRSVNACFRTNPNTGVKEFRYYDLSDAPMKIEVPADQYSGAIETMKTRIAEGTVKGVSDPNAAYDIIRKGKLSYTQARNMAKAGNIDSLKFDAATGAVTCLSALGVSSVVTFAQVLWHSKDPKLAARYALVAGLRVYGLSFAGSIIASQISRTGATNALKPLAAEISTTLSPKIVQSIVNSFRTIAGKNAIYGTAAQKYFAKILGSNLITEGIMLAVFAIPDTYKRISGKVSTAQYTKNMTSLVLSFFGTVAGTAATGAALGKFAGDIIPVKAFKPIAMVGGLVAGGIAGAITKAVGDLLHEDDAIITTRMFNAVLISMALDHLLSDEEQEAVIKQLNEESKALEELQKNLFKSKSQEADIRAFLQPKIDAAIKDRKEVTAEDEIQLHANIDDLIIKGELTDEL